MADATATAANITTPAVQPTGLMILNPLFGSSSKEQYQQSQIYDALCVVFGKT
jgi:hypothetical protein